MLRFYRREISSRMEYTTCLNGNCSKEMKPGDKTYCIEMIAGHGFPAEFRFCSEQCLGTYLRENGLAPGAGGRFRVMPKAEVLRYIRRRRREWTEKLESIWPSAA